MSRLAIVGLALCTTGFAAEDPWQKVIDIKSGTDLRIYKRGDRQPVLAKMDEANDERILVVIKDTQTAIPRIDIDRLDARPSGGSRVTKETATKVEDSPPDLKPGPPRRGGPNQSVSSGTNVSFGGKPDFATVYRRPPGPPQGATAKPQ